MRLFFDEFPVMVCLRGWIQIAHNRKVRDGGIFPEFVQQQQRKLPDAVDGQDAAGIRLWFGFDEADTIVFVGFS